MVHGMLKAPQAPFGRKNRVAGVRRLLRPKGACGAFSMPWTIG